MPASAEQLLLAGVTTARDLGAPLDASVNVKRRIADGEIAGPRLFISGPFLQDEPYPGTELYRWGSGQPGAGPRSRPQARARGRRRHQAGRSGT